MEPFEERLRRRERERWRRRKEGAGKDMRAPGLFEGACEIASSVKIVQKGNITLSLYTVLRMWISDMTPLCTRQNVLKQIEMVS